MESSLWRLEQKQENLDGKQEQGISPDINMRENHAGLALLQTVHKNFEGFTKKQVEKALLACNVQAMVGHPSDMVSSPSMKNCPVDPVDVTNSLAIFGPNRPDLRGKTVRQKPTRVEPELS